MVPETSGLALASLRRESAPYCSQQPSSHPFSFATGLPTRSATPHFGYPRVRPAVSTPHREAKVTVTGEIAVTLRPASVNISLNSVPTLAATIENTTNIAAQVHPHP
ncbi:MAG: hypothetical protein WBE76_22125 [Terracidiphilus sp.]